MLCNQIGSLFSSSRRSNNCEPGGGGWVNKGFLLPGDEDSKDSSIEPEVASEGLATENRFTIAGSRNSVIGSVVPELPGADDGLAGSNDAEKWCGAGIQ